MKRLLPQHKWLAVLAAIAVGATAAYYFVVLAPLHQTLTQARGEKEELQDELQQTGWPLHAEKLRDIREDEKQELRRLTIRSRNILKWATHMYEARIERLYASRDAFLERVSRLDYQEQYNRIVQDLREQNVNLYGNVLGIGEDTSSPYIYQLMLRLWTVEIIANTIIDSGLNIVKLPKTTFYDRFGNEYAASDIKVLPMHAYTLDSGTDQPYLLEFPVKVTVRGNMNQLMTLLGQLQPLPDTDNKNAENGGAFQTDVGENNDNSTEEGDAPDNGVDGFVPVSRLELKKVAPTQKGKPGSAEIRGRLILSCFFQMRELTTDEDISIDTDSEDSGEKSSRPPLGF